MAKGLGKIEHIVLLMMENRSFDHYLGAINFDAEKPRPDVRGLGPNDLENLAMPVNRYLDGKDGDPGVDPWCIDDLAMDMPDPPHEMEAVAEQWNQGHMDGFVSAYQRAYRKYAPEGERALLGLSPTPISDLPLKMARMVAGYYTRKTLPVLYALADQFTICDNWFASYRGSTHPNRVFSQAGHCGSVLHTGFGSVFAAKPPPVWDAWGRSDDNPGGLVWRSYLPDAEKLSTFLLWLGFYIGHEKERGSLQSFVDECAAGTLPQVAIVEPPYSIADDHPSHDPRRGQRFLEFVFNALCQSDCWSKCAVILYYDEHGGFFDHVPPPVVPGCKPPFDTLGFRVPAVVASPYALRGKAVHTQFDHRSVLKTVAERWKLPLPQVEGTDWNRISSLWESCFDFSQRPLARDQVQLPRVTADWRTALDSSGDLPPRSQLADTFTKMAHLANAESMRALLGE